MKNITGFANNTSTVFVFLVNFFIYAIKKNVKKNIFVNSGTLKLSCIVGQETLSMTMCLALCVNPQKSKVILKTRPDTRIPVVDSWGRGYATRTDTRLPQSRAGEEH